ncbi:hypothetical protein CROQUDRAFT_664295 [Cronartium quercuum f. sp. fusiforme G11]|uniref:Uncharacterized protein n=1 Tax=Cronartium quercuum f. sp. fusiforme G11 TaxID=708437 RepID=A0A9P6N8S8_9BASI|nr:hypothetical protein CROQUDRAFT_664295 [Cronartium quercuum f. sp. fusiforme G11]
MVHPRMHQCIPGCTGASPDVPVNPRMHHSRRLLTPTSPAINYPSVPTKRNKPPTLRLMQACAQKPSEAHLQSSSTGKHLTDNATL